MSPRGPRKRLARGIYEDRSGIEARVQVKGLQDVRRFPRTADRDDIRTWQDKARAALRKRARSLPVGPFVDDVRRYLKAVSSMPTYAERVRHMDDWIAAFGPRRRETISAAEIRATLETWRELHHWSASALNHRRTALQHLFNVLDGKASENPVRDVPRYGEPDALPRGVPWPLVRRVLKAMPPSVDRIRLAVETWTGLPHATLARLTRESVDFQHRTLARPGRRKGHGTSAALIPLTRRAVWYFRLLDRAKGWGPFDRWHLRREWRKACRAVEAAARETGEEIDLSAVRVYDATRHSFGTWAYAATHDLAATAGLLGHASLKTTQRYTLAAVPAVLSAAVAKIEAKTGENVERPRGPARANSAQVLVFKGSRP